MGLLLMTTDTMAVQKPPVDDCRMLAHFEQDILKPRLDVAESTQEEEAITNIKHQLEESYVPSTAMQIAAVGKIVFHKITNKVCTGIGIAAICGLTEGYQLTNLPSFSYALTAFVTAYSTAALFGAAGTITMLTRMSRLRSNVMVNNTLKVLKDNPDVDRILVMIG